MTVKEILLQQAQAEGDWLRLKKGVCVMRSKNYTIFLMTELLDSDLETIQKVINEIEEEERKDTFIKLLYEAEEKGKLATLKKSVRVMRSKGYNIPQMVELLDSNFVTIEKVIAEIEAEAKK